MTKTLMIDGKKVDFKVTASLMYRYKEQFNREFLKDLNDIRLLKEKDEKGNYDLTKLNLNMLYDLIWTMAKTADNTIPDPVSWLDTFETFPVTDVWKELLPIVAQSLQLDRKNV